MRHDQFPQDNKTTENVPQAESGLNKIFDELREKYADQIHSAEEVIAKAEATELASPIGKMPNFEEKNYLNAMSLLVDLKVRMYSEMVERIMERRDLNKEEKLSQLRGLYRNRASTLTDAALKFRRVAMKSETVHKSDFLQASTGFEMRESKFKVEEAAQNMDLTTERVA